MRAIDRFLAPCRKAANKIVRATYEAWAAGNSPRQRRCIRMRKRILGR